MKQGLLMLALVGVLSLGLTSCGMNNNNPGPDTGMNGGAVTNDNAGGSATNGNSANGGTTNGGTTNGGSANGSGDVGDINNDAIGNADANTNNNANTQAKTATKRTSSIHRSAYDYLNDGRYAASADGKVLPRRGSVGADLTQGARDLIQDAKDLGRDMARDVGDAARSAGNAVRNTGNAAKDSMRTR